LATPLYTVWSEQCVQSAMRRRDILPATDEALNRACRQNLRGVIGIGAGHE